MLTGSVVTRGASMGVGVCVGTTTFVASQGALPSGGGWALLAGWCLSLSFLAGWLVSAVIAPGLAGLSAGRRTAWLLAALAGGVLASIVIPLHPPGGPLAGVVVLEALGIASLAFALLALGCLLSRREARQALPPRPWAWLGYSLPLVGVWGLELLALWPGAMTSDSFDQWAQLTLGRFNDWHPFAHTALLWLATRAWYSPAAIVTVQIVAASAVIGWVLQQFRRLGLSKRATWSLGALIALLPGSSIVLVVWKDVAYSIALVALTGLVLSVVATGGDRLRRWRFLLALGLAVTLTALLRSNGPLAGFGTLVLLALAHRRHWRAVAVVAALAICAWGGIRLVLQPALGVNPAPAKLPWWYAHQVAAHVAAGTPLTDEEEAVLIRLAPSSRGKLSYDPFHIDTTVFDGHFRTEQLTEEHTIPQLWRALLLRRPMVNLRHVSLASQSVWQVSHPARMQLLTIALSTDASGHTSALDGVEVLAQFLPPELLAQATPVSAPRLPALTEPFVAWLRASARPAWSWLAWGGAFPLYLLCAGALLTSLRAGRWSAALVAAPAVLNSLGLTVFAVSSEFRFLSPTFFCGMLFGSFLLWGPWRPGREVAAATAGEP